MQYEFNRDLLHNQLSIHSFILPSIHSSLHSHLTIHSSLHPFIHSIHILPSIPSCLHSFIHSKLCCKDFRLSQYLNPVTRRVPQSGRYITIIFGLFRSQLMAWYGKGRTTPPLKSCLIRGVQMAWNICYV